MNTLSLGIIALGVALLVGAGWLGLRQYQKHRKHVDVDCVQRDAAFERQIASIKQDAHEQLKIGTTKASVSEFFKKHGMSFTMAESEASGISYSTGGCAPLGCGTDRVAIRVVVKVDEDGTVTAEPAVDYMYVDCV